MMKALFDSQGRVSWRRFTLLCIGTALFVAGLLSEPSWMVLATIYIGGDTLERVLAPPRPA